MTSGRTLRPSFASWHAASKMARACISVISGYVTPEAHAAVAEHRVELVELLDAVQQRLLLRQFGRVAALDLELGDLDHQVFTLRQELVQRRVDRPDGDRLAVHGLEHAVEVARAAAAAARPGPRGDPSRCRRGSCAAPSRCGLRRRTCARCGRGRCPARRTRTPAPTDPAGRRWRGCPACGPCRPSPAAC